MKLPFSTSKTKPNQNAGQETIQVQVPKSDKKKRNEKAKFVSLYDLELPKTLEEAYEKYPYLKSYVEAAGITPEYVIDPSMVGSGSDLMSAAFVLDIVYPIGLGAFVHIKFGGEYGKYNIIEPEKPPRKILEQVEDAIAKAITEKTIVAEGAKEKERLIEKLFKEAVKKRTLKLPPGKQKNVLYHFLREKVGHGVLDDFLADPWLEDISVPGAGHVYVYHKFFGALESNTNISLEDGESLLRGLAERHGKVLSYTNPILDVHLEDGSRFNIVFGEDISIKGSNFTIRKFPKEPISVAHCIKWKTMSAELGAYMWILLEMGISFFMCGETASGKTTSLNAFVGLIKPDAKIVSIEETPEVNLAHRNWVREVTRLHTGSKVTMFDLLKAALRQRPDQIIVGEIRGEEGQIAFQAIETGHPVVSTIHAGDLQTLFQRLTSSPIDVPKSHMNGLNVAIFQNRIKRGLKLVRRVTSVNEIINYDQEEGQLNFLPIFTFDSDEDLLRFSGTSFLLEAKILPYRGWPPERLPELYEELKMRAAILTALADKHPRFKDVWNTVIEVESVGVEEVYRKVKEGQFTWLSD
ncbi:MAG: type II/IV secretion system ATPase subunit [Candidatus Bathyarchaeia archaeon]|jgi:flagellar protein FlaI